MARWVRYSFISPFRGRWEANSRLSDLEVNIVKAPLRAACELGCLKVNWKHSLYTWVGFLVSPAQYYLGINPLHYSLEFGQTCLYFSPDCVQRFFSVKVGKRLAQRPNGRSPLLSPPANVTSRSLGEGPSDPPEHKSRFLFLLESREIQYQEVASLLMSLNPVAKHAIPGKSERRKGL